MFIKVAKFIAVLAMIAGIIYIYGVVGSDDFAKLNGETIPFGQTLRETGRGLLIAGAGALVMFLAKWREWEAEQKKKRGGRR